MHNESKDLGSLIFKWINSDQSTLTLLIPGRYVA